jgi:hypothetical protein
MTSPAITPALNPFFGLLPQELWDKAKDFFIYGADWTSLDASETETQDIAIESDSDFLIVAGNAVAYASASPETVIDDRPFTVQIYDNGSGRRAMNRPIHIDNFFGDGKLPGYWPFPKLIPRASTLSTTLTNLDTANAYVVKIGYMGFKIFGGF